MNADTSFWAALAIYALHMYMATMLLVLPFGKRHVTSYWRVAVYCIVAVACCMVFFWPACPVVRMLPPPVLLAVQALWMFIGFGAAFWLTKAPLWPMLFASALMGQYLNAVYTMANVLEQNYFPADETKWVYFGLFAAVLALTLPIVLPVFLLELRPLVQQGGARVSWQWLWPVPVLFNIVFHVKFYSGNFTAKLMDIRADLSAALLWLVATFAACMLMLHAVRKGLAGAQAQEELGLAALRSDMQRQQNEQLLRHMEDVRRAEHDLRHHLHALYGLAQADGSKTVQEYISALQMAEEPQGILPCANTALSAVLNYYLSGAVAAGVKVSGHVALPAALGKAESDVCLVTGNLVENAVAAACGQMQGTKFIQVDARMQGGLLSLCIKNSGAVPLVYRHGALWSTRRNAAGIGTASVAAVCRQRQGFARYEQKDGVFTALACMNIEQ